MTDFLDPRDHFLLRFQVERPDSATHVSFVGYDVVGVARVKSADCEDELLPTVNIS